VIGIGGAYGGAGGSSSTAGGAGGAGTASLTLTGTSSASSVTATITATGGAGGKGAAGGNATATSDAIDSTASITSSATATGGNGGSSAGTASATAIGNGASGDAQSAAVSGNITTGGLVTAASANADTPVAGASTALTWAAIGNGAISAPALVTTDQAVAQITAEPTATDVATINTANPAINTAFHNNDPTPVYFAIGELGGAYSTSAVGQETETSSVHMTVDLTKAGTLHDLLIGFYSGAGSGFIANGMTLDVKINGVDDNTTFADVTAANAFFRNNAHDYGDLNLLGSTTLTLDISLSITESAAGGYDFGMLIGDPPPAHEAAAQNNLVAAIATFGTGASGSSGNFTPEQRDNHQAMLAANAA
jgi:hypothetical protein